MPDSRDLLGVWPPPPGEEAILEEKGVSGSAWGWITQHSFHGDNECILFYSNNNFIYFFFGMTGPQTASGGGERRNTSLDTVSLALELCVLLMALTSFWIPPNSTSSSRPRDSE